jgi:Putative lactococcus lactis phage r1t holin
VFIWMFWRLAIERAVKTFAQTLAAVLGAGGIGLIDAAWLTALSTAAVASLVSLLTSVASAPIGRPNDPSLLSQPAGLQRAGSPDRAGALEVAGGR